MDDRNNVVPIREPLALQHDAATAEGCRKVLGAMLQGTRPAFLVPTGPGMYVAADRTDGTMMVHCRGDGRLDAVLSLSDDHEVPAVVICQRCAGRGCAKPGEATA